MFPSNLISLSDLSTQEKETFCLPAIPGFLGCHRLGDKLAVVSKEQALRIKISIFMKGFQLWQKYDIEESMDFLGEGCLCQRENKIYWATLKTANIYVLSGDGSISDKISKVPGKPISFLLKDIYYYGSDNTICAIQYAYSSLRNYRLPAMEAGMLLPFVGPALFHLSLKGTEDESYLSIDLYNLKKSSWIRNVSNNALFVRFQPGPQESTVKLCTKNWVEKKESIVEINLAEGMLV